MNLYRIANVSDETQDCICLKCFGTFTTGHDCSNWKFCPLCGTKWDGVFTKRNPRYRQKSPNPGYKICPKTKLFIQSDKPRLIIECGQFVTKRLANEGFDAVNYEPKLRWDLVSHATTGWYRDVSAFVFEFRSFKNCVSEGCYSHLRLRLLVGEESKIIKTWERHGRDSANSNPS